MLMCVMLSKKYYMFIFWLHHRPLLLRGASMGVHLRSPHQSRCAPRGLIARASPVCDALPQPSMTPSSTHPPTAAPFESHLQVVGRGKGHGGEPARDIKAKLPKNEFLSVVS